MKNPLKVIAEMFGRNDPPSGLLKKFRHWFGNLANFSSIDYARTNYALTKAIYYASTVKGQDGKTYGDKFLLGAVFGKPIVKATAGFAFASPPEVVVKSGGSKGNKKASDYLNGWIKENWKYLFDNAKWVFRDGDGYVEVTDDLEVKLIPADRVDIQVDPLTGEVNGYTVTNIVKITDAQGTENTEKYVTLYTEKWPYKEVRHYKDINDDTFTVISKNGNDVEVKEDGTFVVSGGDNEEQPLEESDEIRPLSVVGFHNEKEAGSVYGVSEYQNVYYLMSNYHGVLENAIKNNIFNSQTLPYVTGIADQKKFLETYGVKQDDGSYKINWEPDTVFIGGENFGVKFAEGAHNADEAKQLLEVLFWLICQTTETPEFVFGTAVQSSKASVSEQMPVMVRKAVAKQQDQIIYYRKLIDLVLYKAQKATELTAVVDDEGNSLLDYDLVMPKIVSEDKKLNLEIIKVLSEEGVITDHTKMVLMEMGQYVDDIDKEIKEARKESEDKREKVDKIFGQGNQNLDDDTPEDEPEDNPEDNPEE